MNLWCITVIRRKLLLITIWRIRFLSVAGCFISSQQVKNPLFKSHTNTIFKCKKMHLGHQAHSRCFLKQSSNTPCSCKQTSPRLSYPHTFRKSCLWRGSLLLQGKGLCREYYECFFLSSPGKRKMPKQHFSNSLIIYFFSTFQVTGFFY